MNLSALSAWGESLRVWWQGAAPPARAIAAGLAVLMVIGLVVAASLAASPDYHAIYPRARGKDASAIEAGLRGKSIQMHFDDTEGTGVLPEDTLVGGQGHLDKIPIGTTPEVERQRMLSQAQAELSRKLMQLDPVQTAAVSLRLPSESSFVGSGTPPTASVLLTLRQGERLSGLQIKGIVNLIARAIPNLTTQNVALTDQTGVLLWKGNGAAGTSAAGTGRGL